MKAVSTENDSRFQVKKVFFKRLYRLVKVFWVRKNTLKAWVMLISILLFTVLASLLYGYFSYKTAEVTNLQLARDHKYWTLFIWVTFILFSRQFLIMGTNLITQKLKLDWREWLTQYLVQCYMRERVYYSIEFSDDEIDNPDQRIQEQVELFCTKISEIPDALLGNSLNIGIQFGILCSVSYVFLGANIFYIVLMTATAYWFMLPLIKKNWIEIQAKANFRTSLLNVREYSENIAFFRGEKYTLHDIRSKILSVFNISKNILIYQKLVYIANIFISLLPTLFPALILVPLFFSGEISYGTILQATVAAGILVESFSRVYGYIPKLAELAPLTVRLAEIQEKPEKNRQSLALRNLSDCIQFYPNEFIKLEHLNLLTPGAEQKLAQNLNISLNTGDHLLITGRTGIGKSSLLRVMAGLWDRGSGQVGLPDQKNLMFFPQRPYMLNADLRSQLIYPAYSTSYSDEELQEILVKVGKGYISERYGGFNAVRNWGRELSLGEQQCISMARLLIHKPKYAFLDEASSALDLETEQNIYRQILQSGTTIISVGHRASIVPFHRYNLNLLGEGKWKLQDIENYLGFTDQTPVQNNENVHISQNMALDISDLNKEISSDEHITTEVPRNDLKINKLFFNRVWQLFKPYWFRKQAWKAWIAYIISFSTLIVYGISAGYFSFLTANQVNSLVAKHEEAYWHFFILLTLLGVTRSLAYALLSYMQKFVELKWEAWLSVYFSKIYLENRTYYEILNEDKIDNPDQRIQNEIGPFCTNISSLTHKLLESFLDISVQIFILLTISVPLLSFLIIFSIINFIVTLFVIKPTIKKNFYITKSEADLRYSLLRVRENAENIAFYRGETSEMKQIFIRLRLVIKNKWNLDLYSFFANLCLMPLSILLYIGPTLILVPLYFNHQISYGQVVQATVAVTIITNAFIHITQFIPELSKMVPGVVRLAEILEKAREIRLSLGRTSSQNNPNYFTLSEAQSLKFDHVNLFTPGGELSLVQDLNLEIRPQQHYVIIGQTGVGKSSLLRALAGLWHRGSGHISSPPEKDKIFLAQRPYLMEGTLRSQLIYPELETSHSDEELLAILEIVQLGDLIQKYGNLDTYNHWGKKLSLGEQQRIGFARILIKPRKFIFLDEATSAVDSQIEHQLYSALLETGATLISICHKKTAWKYHDYYLKLMAEGKYEVGEITEVTIA
jgi:putative ATP-binding cassette transporter